MNDTNDSEFATRKWNTVNDNSNSNYAAANESTYNRQILKSNLCVYNDAYILVTGDIIVVAAPATQAIFKNCAPFTKYPTKIDGTTIDDAEDLDIGYSSNYSETTRNLCFCSKDEASDFNAVLVNDNNFKFFKYKAKLLGNTVALADNLPMEY